MFNGGYGRNYNGNIENYFIQKSKLEDFKKYLKQKGYSEYTPNGNKSTLFHYCYWIEKICKREHISLEELQVNISFYVARYDIGGQEEDFGTNGHNAAKNSLKRYQEYLQNN